MFCTVCGNKIEQPADKVIFCPFCGAELAKKGTIPNQSTQLPNQFLTQTQTFNPVPPQRSSPQIPADDVSSTIRPSYSDHPLDQRYSGFRNDILPIISPYGTFGRRFFAFLIDLLLIWGFTYFTSSFFLPGLFDDMMAYLEIYNTIDPNTASEVELTDLMNIGLGLLIRFEFFNWGVSTVYFFLFTWILKGRTPGKAIFKLVVVDQNSLLPVTHVGKIFVDNLTRRPLLMILDLFFGAMASPGPRNQYRITQKLSKLAVVKSSMIGALGSSPEITINPPF